MDDFKNKLSEQALKSLEVTERILAGEEVSMLQARTATSLISGKLKSQAVENGRITQIISLTKIGIKDAEKREAIASTALRELIPAAMIASGEAEAKSRKALAK